VRSLLDDLVNFCDGSSKNILMDAFEKKGCCRLQAAGFAAE